MGTYLNKVETLYDARYFKQQVKVGQSKLAIPLPRTQMWRRCSKPIYGKLLTANT
ncbi:hypothetical protein CCACVL1_29823 [Corchorus capsularis]|uniref:Uncharacterized protein n=1 Tax=Corchorus capsularis TaxID=210143 RepID=A0A1R3FZZ6_COCAP|nr:hypothetical protein CCACVL1_29823 [Corchorus capsularis]